MKEKEKVYGGDYDYYMEDLTWEQVQELYSQNNVGEVSLLRFAGNSFYGEKSNSTMLSVGEIDENFTQRFSLNQYLLAGRFPQDENELVISESFLKKNNMNTEIGDTISLTLGSRIWDEYNAQLSGLTNYRDEEESFVPTKEKAYVVVGILSDVNDSKSQQTIMPLQALTKRHPILLRMSRQRIYPIRSIQKPKKWLRQ